MNDINIGGIIAASGIPAHPYGEGYWGVGHLAGIGHFAITLCTVDGHPMLECADVAPGRSVTLGAIRADGDAPAALRRLYDIDAAWGRIIFNHEAVRKALKRGALGTQWSASGKGIECGMAFLDAVLMADGTVLLAEPDGHVAHRIPALDGVVDEERLTDTVRRICDAPPEPLDEAEHILRQHGVETVRADGTLTARGDGWEATIAMRGDAIVLTETTPGHGEYATGRAGLGQWLAHHIARMRRDARTADALAAVTGDATVLPTGDGGIVVIDRQGRVREIGCDAAGRLDEAALEEAVRQAH